MNDVKAEYSTVGVLGNRCGEGGYERTNLQCFILRKTCEFPVHRICDNSVLFFSVSEKFSYLRISVP